MQSVDSHDSESGASVTEQQQHTSPEYHHMDDDDLSLDDIYNFDGANAEEDETDLDKELAAIHD